MSAARELTRQILRRFVDSFDTILFDCDGVLWHGNDVVKRAPELIGRLREMGKQPLFVTNNSTKSRRQYVEKFTKLGFQVSEEEIFCTAYLAAIYMRNILNFQGRAYLMGSSGMEEEFKKVNINYTGTGRDYPEEDVLNYANIKIDKDISAVIIGNDSHFSYKKLILAVSYASKPDMTFIVSDCEGPIPVKREGRVVVAAGTGTIVKAVETASGREALVLGKPNKYMVELIKEKYPLDPARTVMVGDRLNTDILLGKNCGLQTLLVLSGVSSLADVEANKSSNNITDRNCIPDYFIEDVTKLDEFLVEL